VPQRDKPAQQVSLPRRHFLIRCWQGACAALFSPSLASRASATAPASDAQVVQPEFHFEPHYRQKRPVDAALLKVQPGLDDFITEKYADDLSRVLGGWSQDLLRNPHAIDAVGRVLAPDFLAPSLNPIQSKPVRSGVVEVYELNFAGESDLGRDAFLKELRSVMSPFVTVLTAEFQVTGIEVMPESRPGNTQGEGTTGGRLGTDLRRSVNTHVRYELVGSGRDFHREQRVGFWEMEWEVVWNSSGGPAFRLRRWKTLGETRSHSFHPIFREISASALGGTASYSAQLLHGSDYWRTVLDGACGIDVYGHNGVSIGDVDNDGFDDLYVCQPAGLPNRLYRNRGDGTFEDITEFSGVGILENTSCALLADIDNDGRQDLIVVRTSGPLLFLNQGGGRFQLKPDAFKFANPPQGTFAGAAVADYDRDGWLDVYFCLYIYYQGAGQYKYPTPYYSAENGPPNFLMRNNRDGTFSDVTAATGLDRNNTRYSFCCTWGDYNDDGWPDLYVVNDFGRKNLYRNNGDGTFTDVAAQTGTEDVGAGMSGCWLDYDNDGREDLYVADMWTAAGERLTSQQNFKPRAPQGVRALYRKHAQGNSMFRNHGETFEDATRAAGTGMGRWAWSSDAWDFDHDGYPDLYIANGMVSGPLREDLNSFFWRQVVGNSPDDAKPSYNYEQGWDAINELIRGDGTWSGYERNVFYTNNRNGTFSDVSGAVGLDFVEDGRSFALSDFDHDGRLEVFLKNRNAPQLRLLRNVVEDLPPSIGFRLRGTRSNRDAIGAVVTLKTEQGRQRRALQVGSGFLSQHSKELFFGLGPTKGPVEASVRWPSGLLQELRGLAVNHRVLLEEGSEPRLEPFTSASRFLASPQEHDPVSAGSGARAEDAAQGQGKRGEHELLPSTVETWLLAPLSAPDFSLADLAGRKLNLAAFSGKSLLLNFWSAESPECRKDLITFSEVYERWANRGLKLLALHVGDAPPPEKLLAWVANEQFVSSIAQASDDVAAIYNILYRYLFDRHRDLPLPVSLLINGRGEIVKVYQGPVNPAHVEEDVRNIPGTDRERLARGLPFSGVSEGFEFQRNYLSYGSVFFQRGYYEQAGASFERALRDSPSSAEAAYGLGSVYLQQQRNLEAREWFERAQRLKTSYPDNLPSILNNLGLLLAREGRGSEAAGYFQESLRLSPDYLIALTNLGNVYRQLGQWDEARRILERAVAVAPEDAEANYSLGMAYAQLNDTARAHDYLERALQFRPAYPEALNNLGVLYVRTQRPDDAIKSFEDCIRIAPGFDQSYLNLARVYVLQGSPDKARSVLQQLLKEHPNHAQAQEMLEKLGG
jgi:tetratricopeptide (TPR) repeat protein